MRKGKLTPLQEELYVFIVEYVARYQNFPTTRECVRGTSYRSTSAVYYTLNKKFLEENLITKHEMVNIPPHYSVMNMNFTPPQRYLDIKTPTFAQGIRDAITSSKKETSDFTH